MRKQVDKDAPFANERYVRRNVAGKLHTTHVSFRGDIVAMWNYLRDKPTAAHVAIILFAIGYFIWPVDAVPDVIPVVGYLDDAAVIAAAIASLGSVLEKYR